MNNAYSTGGIPPARSSQKVAAPRRGIRESREFRKLAEALEHRRLRLTISGLYGARYVTLRPALALR